jgi:hypothetical protein
MTTMERKTLESAARTYSDLRGLLAVPLGALMILAALSNWGWGPFEPTWVFVAGLVAVAGLTLAISRYDDACFGRITSTTSEQVRAAVVTLGATALVLAGSLILRSKAGWSLDMPVNALAAALAAGMLANYAVTVGPRRHHLIIWGGVLVAGLLPVWGGLSLSDTSNVGLVIYGVAAMLSGVFDHYLLVRRFGPSRALTLEAGNGGA